MSPVVLTATCAHGASCLTNGPVTPTRTLWPDRVGRGRGTPAGLRKLGWVSVPLCFLVCPVGNMTVAVVVGRGVKEGAECTPARGRALSTRG